MSPLNLLRRILPKRWIRIYHRMLAISAAWWYGRPSRRMVVIGVTGTDGKSTTAAMIASVLEAAGTQVGLISSVTFKIGDREWLNQTHMTMPGRFALQRLLRDMVRAGCTHAVLEVSSEGLLQFRHRGIDFDGAVITNLSPEHIEAHGSFEQYRNTKGRLFSQIIRSGDKVLQGQPVSKFSVVNLDDAEAPYFLSFWAEHRHGVTLQAAIPEADQNKEVTVWQATHIEAHGSRSTFSVAGQDFEVSLPGRYNVYNAVEAIAIARSLKIDWPAIQTGIKKFQGLPGRFEIIEGANGKKAIVDDALTPAALEHFFEAVKQAGAKTIIAVLGAAGGGRDKWKRPELGKILGQYVDRVILTSDDPYDEDPKTIAQEIQKGIPEAMHDHVETIVDRKEAIRKGLELAEPGDVVTVTGMGSETSMMVKGKRVPWNDAAAVREVL